MKEYLTIRHDDMSEELVEEPASPYGFSYADYITWNFKERIELIRGRIVKMSPAPTVLHQKILSNLFITIGSFLKDKPCNILVAPVDVKLKGKPYRKRKLPDDQVMTVVQPDIIVVCDAEKLADNRCVDGAPEFVVEILSPGNTRTETKYKFDLYEENGVQEYWVVYPEYCQVHVYLLNAQEKYGKPVIYEAGEDITAAVLNGLTICTTDIFKL